LFEPYYTFFKVPYVNTDYKIGRSQTLPNNRKKFLKAIKISYFNNSFRLRI